MRRHLTYANVMSTLGVFLGLAGGYTIAKVTGDGALKSGQVTDVGANTQTVLTFPGMGKVTARCVGGTDTEVGWRHTGKRQHRVSVEFEDAETSFLSAPGSHHEYTMPDQGSKLTFNVFLAKGNDEPQVSVDVVGSGIFAGACAENVAAIGTSTAP